MFDIIVSPGKINWRHGDANAAGRVLKSNCGTTACGAGQLQVRQTFSGFRGMSEPAECWTGEADCLAWARGERASRLRS
jgi:hypothetical protein